jgi:hypothetical protein
MPHSTAIGKTSLPAAAEEDIVVPDAPPQSPDNVREVEGNHDSESAPHVNDVTRPASKIDIKHEDLFDDDDEDDEKFPSSGGEHGNVESSPPTAPV